MKSKQVIRSVALSLLAWYFPSKNNLSSIYGRREHPLVINEVKIERQESPLERSIQKGTCARSGVAKLDEYTFLICPQGKINWQPDLSSDGNKIVFGVEPDPSSLPPDLDVYLVDLNSKSMDAIAQTKSEERYPSISADGSLVSFEAIRGGKLVGLVADLERNVVSQVMVKAEPVSGVKLIKKNKKILVRDQKEMYLVEGEKGLLLDEKVFYLVTVSDDGKKVAFVGSNEGDFQGEDVYVVDLERKVKANVTGFFDGKNNFYDIKFSNDDLIASAVVYGRGKYGYRVNKWNLVSREYLGPSPEKLKELNVPFVKKVSLDGSTTISFTESGFLKVEKIRH